MTPWLPVLIYAVAKYAAYCGWCFLLPGAARDRWWRRGFGLGLVRVILGLLVGSAVAVAGAHLAYAARVPVGFTLILLPIRWLEWNLVATLGLAMPPLPHLVLAGATGRQRLWRVGGILVWFGTEAVALVAVGSLGGLVC
jgi:hypothetical protein